MSNEKMTLANYVARKGSGAAKQSLRIIERTIESRLVGDNVPQAEVSANLRKALGIPQGTETTEQRDMMAKLLRSANWASYEAPPSEGELSTVLTSSNWGGLVKVSQALGYTPPKLNVIAKKVARRLLTDNIDSSFVVDEHGGEKQFAVNAVLEKLFPKAANGEDPKTSREAYLSRLFDEMLAILGE